MTSKIISIAKDLLNKDEFVFAHKNQRILSLIRNITCVKDIHSDQKIGILCKTNGDSNGIVIVNHFDLINLFQNDRKHKFYETLTELKGALDNTIMNAIIIYMLQENLIPNGTTILFSDGEETGFWGIRTYLNQYHLDGNFYINLDVTTQIKNESIAFEYDQWKPDFVTSFSKSINDFPESEKILFHNERYTDDLSPILHHGGNGTSLCLATRNTIHSYKCETDISYISDFVGFFEYFLLDITTDS